MAKKSRVSSPQPAMDREYRDEDDHRTMMRAGEIAADGSRMAGVKRHQKKQEKALSRMRPLIGGHTMRKGGR
jgi:hypothetical protein